MSDNPIFYMVVAGDLRWKREQSREAKGKSQEDTKGIGKMQREER